jgi:hypothetical protein
MDITLNERLEKILKENNCYEQHIVSVKDFYESFLISILIPPIYEGFNSLYKQAQKTEEKFIIQARKNPKITPHNIFYYFESLLRDIPKLNSHLMKTETDRIKATSKNADIFDDLVKAVIRSNIILLTYNTDSDRQNLLDSRYHENIVIPDFIHNCYISSSYMFFTCSNLFYHKFEEQILNQNKLTIYSIIEKGIKEAIRNALPMKEILLNYNTQKYEKKHTEEKPYINISEIDESTKKSEETNDFDEIQTSEKDKSEKDKSEKVEEKVEKEPEIRMVDMSGIDMNKGHMKYFMNEIAKKKDVEIVKSNSAKDIVNEILEV